MTPHSVYDLVIYIYIIHPAHFWGRKHQTNGSQAEEKVKLNVSIQGWLGSEHSSCSGCSSIATPCGWCQKIWWGPAALATTWSLDTHIYIYIVHIIYIYIYDINTNIYMHIYMHIYMYIYIYTRMIYRFAYYIYVHVTCMLYTSYSK